LTITITKWKLTKWIIIAFILVCGTGQAVDVPRIVENVAWCREFMAGFTGYENYNLLDVYELRPGLFGVVMLDPVGFRETHVYDCRNGKREEIWRDADIPPKTRREALRRESILVSAAVSLAKKIL
jgi:hypothetical protein